MNAIAVELLRELTGRGIRLEPAGEYIDVEPSELLSDDDRARIRAHKPELLTLLLASMWCPVCGDDATTKIDGRQFCDRHAPTTPTRRALLEACDLYQGLHRRLDAMQDAGEWESHRALLPHYFAAGDQVRALGDAARREAGYE